MATRYVPSHSQLGTEKPEATFASGSSRPSGNSMLDEVSVFARLDSELYGALVHAVDVTSVAVNADFAAARVFGAPVTLQTGYVSACRLRLTPAETAALSHWPTDEGSLLEYVRQRDIKDGVFRPREVMDELEYARQRLYRRIEAHTTVTDAFCVAFALEEAAWCCMAFLRCGESERFHEPMLDAVDRLRPSLSRVVLRGLQRELVPRGYDLRRSEEGMVHQPVSTAELLGKLSKTEMHVLGYLRSEMTEKRIADTIGRSPHTVHVHVKNIYRKLGVSSRKDLLTLFNA